MAALTQQQQVQVAHGLKRMAPQLFGKKQHIRYRWHPVGINPLYVPQSRNCSWFRQWLWGWEFHVLIDEELCGVFDIVDVDDEVLITFPHEYLVVNIKKERENMRGQLATG